MSWKIVFLSGFLYGILFLIFLGISFEVFFWKYLFLFFVFIVESEFMFL